MRTYAGHSSPAESNALYRHNLAKGQTGLSVAFDLPTQTGYDPDDELAVGEVGKVGVPVTHIGDMRALFDGIPLDEMNTSMTINATAMWLLALYQAVAEEHGHDVSKLAGHDAERHHQGVPVARDLRLPARALDAADHRHGRLHGDGHAEVEPDQHLQLPPAGGRGDAGAGGRLRAQHRDRRPRLGARLRPGAAGALRRGRRAHLLLRQRGRPLRRGDVQDARLHPALGRADAGALRRRGPQAPPLPLRRAGQLAGPDRGAAGEQRPAHRAGDARASRCPATPAPAPCSCRPGTRRSACPGRGTSSGRCGCSRCSPSRPTCSSTRTCSPARSSSSRRSPRSSRAPGPRSPGCRRWAARSRRSSPAT